MLSGLHLRASSLLHRRVLRLSFAEFSDDSGGKNDAKQKLNDLLKSLIQSGQVVDENVAKVQVPKARAEGRKLADKLEEKLKESLGKQLVDAAQTIAEKTPARKDQTEAELLHKLLYKDTALAKDIAKHSKQNVSLTQLVSSMKIERKEEPSQPFVPDRESLSRSEQIRTVVPKLSYSKSFKTPLKRVGLFNAKPLGIFPVTSEKTKHFEKESRINLPTWEACEERELKLAVEHPPASYYEQMIHWTNKGVIWKFPIDNEQGMDDEKQISFEDHVFLEVHLEDWCPQTGPIRHFMELVCVGLSRNHWLKAEEKKEYILWYKDYFLDKKDLLKEVGAGQIGSEEKPSLTAS